MTIQPYPSEQEAIQGWHRAIADAYARGRLHGQEALKDCLDKNEELANLVHALTVENADLRRDAKALIAEAMVGRFDDLIAALRFYADEENYDEFSSDLDNPSSIEVDHGERAQAVLAKYATTDEGGME